ncbi:MULTISPECIES: sulfite exporter TauE/SafE family protein [Halomonas]|uniref:sulfite exporter TauE/SafE family protein n=1 Tax=Halomonas TaxID=2745 RepID=UPI0027DFB7BE|nr:MULTISPECIES: sulfite exporter TauE/SafE family protein [Halomonas]
MIDAAWGCLLQWWALSELTFGTWLWVGGVLALGCFVQRTTGFGMAVVGAPLILLKAPAMVPVVLVVYGFLVSCLVVRRYRREVAMGDISMALVGKVPGTLLGVWLLLIAPMATLEVMIAAIVLFAVLVTLFKLRLPVNRSSLFGAGFLSGIFGAVAAIGGPPIVLLMHGMPMDRLRGNLAAFFLISSLMTLASLAAVGKVPLWLLAVSLSFLPMVLVGHGLGAALAPRLPRRLLQGASLTLCAAAAIGLLLS